MEWQHVSTKSWDEPFVSVTVSRRELLHIILALDATGASAAGPGYEAQTQIFSETGQPSKFARLSTEFRAIPGR